MKLTSEYYKSSLNVIRRFCVFCTFVTFMMCRINVVSQFDPRRKKNKIASKSDILIHNLNDPEGPYHFHRKYFSEVGILATLVHQDPSILYQEFELVDQKCCTVNSLSDVSAASGNSYRILFFSTLREKYNPWCIDFGDEIDNDSICYTVDTKHLIDVIETRSDNDNNKTILTKSQAKQKLHAEIRQAQMKQQLYGTCQSETIVKVRNHLDNLANTEDESKLNQIDKKKLQNINNDMAALINGYHNFPQYNFIDEIAKHKACEFYYDVLQSRFQELNHCCIITGETTNVKITYIIPKRSGSFKRAVNCYRGSRSLVWTRQFLTVHDLRNVLPLKQEWKREYSHLRIAFYFDQAHEKWHLYVPKPNVNKYQRRCKAWDIVHGKNACPNQQFRSDVWISFLN